MNRLTQLNCIQVFHSFILVFSLTNDILEGTGITVVLLPTAGQGGGRDTEALIARSRDLTKHAEGID